METSFSNELTVPQKRVRQSGVELLKVVAIFLVVLSHVVQTLTSWSQPWTIDIYNGLTNPITFIIAILRYAGALGNIIFFTCSAWYLLDKDKTSYQKVMRMILDIFVISIIWFVPVLIWKRSELTRGDILHSLLPTFYSNNWYMTSYILFCFVYPVLNLSIKHLNQRKHLVVAVVLFSAYFGLSFLYSFPWSTTCAFWVTIYYVMSYFKLYGTKLCESKKTNLIILLSAIALHILLIFISNYLYLQYGRIGAMRWNGNNHPLFFLIAFSSLNLMRMTKFNSKGINYVSSLSMLIYIIHENILFRTYIRTLIWEWIYNNLGYDLVILWIFVYVMCLFIASLLVATLYRFTLEKVVHKISDNLLDLIKKVVYKLTNKIVKDPLA